MKKLSICYHGTNKKIAKIILKEGFKKNTYFARHLEDAIGYGGNYIFETAFETKLLPKYWQFRIKYQRHPKHIVGLAFYSKCKILKENKKLRNRIFESNIRTNEKMSRG